MPAHIFRATRRWATLAAIALAFLLVGCDSGEEAPPLPGSGGSAPGAFDPANDPVIRASDLARDPAVMDLSLHVAWYYAHGGRLPAGLAQVRDHVRVPGWPDLPETTADGRPVAYRRADERTFEIVVGDPDGPAAERIAVALEIPENLPTNLGPAPFAEWWKLEVSRQQLGQLKERLEQLGG